MTQASQLCLLLLLLLLLLPDLVRTHFRRETRSFHF